ncbi:MAG: isocitrate/isopropylmalate dehydrogenase family protein [Candidatus Hadarchaeales archaeon]
MRYRISVLPGDGIGPEVVREGVKVLEALAEVTPGLDFEFIYFPCGGEHYLKTGELITDEMLEEMSKTDAIYLGAVGDPRVPTGVLEQGILLRLRFHFDQYVNLRPVKLYPGVPCPLREPKNIDFYVVRENTEDFYIGLGGRFSGRGREQLELVRALYKARFGLDLESDADEIAYQLGVISRRGAERVIRYAFELARRKGKRRVTSVDKANVLTHVYSLWREVFERVSKEYPEIEAEEAFVDATAMWFLKKPEWYGVVVTPNMFGDILTDLGAMLQGGMGMAPGGNLNPEGVSMFEPIHGSAPKYAGKNIANPLATILAACMMLEELGEVQAALTLEQAVKRQLAEGKVLPYDLGGHARTSEVGDELVRKIREISS